MFLKRESVQKAPDGVVVPNDIKGLAESEYRLYTARMKVIEGILIDRIGYKKNIIDATVRERLKEMCE